MNELKDELLAAHVYEWHHVPFTENHHKWWLQWYRIGDDGDFFFSFVSPKKRRYSFYTKSGRVTIAEIVGSDNGARIAWYDESCGNKLDRLEAVLRLTPRHVQYKLYVLFGELGAIE